CESLHQNSLIRVSIFLPRLNRYLQTVPDCQRSHHGPTYDTFNYVATRVNFWYVNYTRNYQHFIIRYFLHMLNKCYKRHRKFLM
ncbi:hypothetical protein L9F63_016765, partial [Diploptera punctata]